MSEVFNGPYIVDTSSEDDWYDKFFDKNVERGFVKILDNADSDGNPLGQSALFRCPCPHAETMNLPINRSDEHPSWGFTMEEDGSMTLRPSILQIANKSPSGKHINCNSHFFIERGKVRWA